MSGEEMRARLLEALCLATPPCQDHLDDLCEVLPVVRAIVAEELRAAALTFEADGAIVSALADQARARFDLAGEAAYAITASDFEHVAGRLRKLASERVDA